MIVINNFKSIKIIIACSRDFNDYNYLEKKVFGILNYIDNNIYGVDKDNIIIISGEAKGADKLGEVFASKYSLQITKYPAKWDYYGNRAGYIRNMKMKEYCLEDCNNSILIALWDGSSRGTSNMIDLCKKTNIRTFIVNYTKDIIEFDKAL